VRQWFRLEKTLASDGTSVFLHLVSHDGNSADRIPDFVEQCGHHILGYATRANVTLDNVFESRYRLSPEDRSNVSRVGIERLLVPAGGNRVLKGSWESVSPTG
jgi:hypothetical protein